MSNKLKNVIQFNNNLLWSYVFFTLPFKKNQRSYCKSSFILTFLILYIVLCAIDKEQSYSIQYGSKIIYIMTHFNLFTTILLMYVVLLTGFIKWKLLLKVKVALHKIDEYIKRNKLNSELSSADHQLVVTATAFFVLSMSMTYG